MIPMVDTHTHLYMTDVFPDGGDAAVGRALEAGVAHMVLPGVSMASAEAQIALHERFPEATSVAPGLHPTEVKPGEWRAEADDIFARFAETRCVAVGEVGMDLYWDRTHTVAQMDAFGYQLDMARRLSLPVIVHSRSAIDETLHVASLMGAECPRLLFHSFTSTPDDVRKILEACPDAMFGFNGVITFKNAAEVRESAAVAGIDRIVSETDAPYLSPVPHRGTTNESSRIPVIIDAIAAATSVTPEEGRRVLARNAESFFSLSL